jgi:hypothetical protein
VIYDVYVLMNGQGKEDPIDAMRAGPKRGVLVIKKRFFNSPNTSLTAELIEPGTARELLPALQNVCLVGANDKGMVIEGTQTVSARPTQKAKQVHFVQRWLCKTPGQQAVFDTEKLSKRSAQRSQSHLASGFDPADDNRTG